MALGMCVMRILFKLKNGETGFLTGYAPGKKGRPLAMLVINGELRGVKLRQIAGIEGFMKIKEPKSKLLYDKFGLSSESTSTVN